MTDLTKEELDEWSERIDAHYRDYPDRNDLITVIPTHDLSRTLAMARAKQAAERERDALLDAIVHADLDSVAEVLRDVIIGDSCEGNCECVIHGLDRLRAVFEAALAQPTAEGGE